MEEGGADDDKDEKSKHDGTHGEPVLGLLLGVDVHLATLVDVAVELVGGGVEDALGTSLLSFVVRVAESKYSEENENW